MNIAKNVTRLAVQSSRQFTTTRALQTAKEDIHPGYFKIKAKQEKFQKDDGLPVYLKGGATDRVLFGITIAGCVSALVVMTKMFYELA